MPLVDGMASTKMIRSFEKTHPSTCLSRRATLNSRIPIFAVSASLVERERETYINVGFDGWILKPIDFKRVGVFLEGIVDENIRNQEVYEPGQWERGGWLQRRPVASPADTKAAEEPASLVRRPRVISPEPLLDANIDTSAAKGKSVTL